MPERRNDRKRILVIGHPLAAEENRLAFRGWEGFQVDLVAPRVWKARSLGHAYRLREARPGGNGEPGLHPLATLASGRNSLFLWVGLGPLLNRLNPDIIYCWEEPWCLSTWQVERFARGLRIPLVFYTAENRPKRLPWPFASLMRSAFAAYRACIAPTAEIAARIKSAGFAGSIRVVPLWIRNRRPLHASPSGRRLAYVGRLIPLKRVDMLVESLALLPGHHLRIIGDGPEKARLAALARDLGVAPRVEFRGHVPNESLESALEGASLLVMPTAENPRQAEQFGKAAVEAVSCGLPVLASRTGNLASLAEAFPTLTAADLDSPAALAEAVTAVFREYPSQAALDRARKSAEETYGPGAAARRLEAAFAEALEDAITDEAAGASAAPDAAARERAR
jgi:glycosyltransferase involved in cell wall biosynthesis